MFYAQHIMYENFGEGGFCAGKIQFYKCNFHNRAHRRYRASADWRMASQNQRDPQLAWVYCDSCLLS